MFLLIFGVVSLFCKSYHTVFLALILEKFTVIKHILYDRDLEIIKFCWIFFLHISAPLHVSLRMRSEWIWLTDLMSGWQPSKYATKYTTNMLLFRNCFVVLCSLVNSVIWVRVCVCVSMCLVMYNSLRHFSHTLSLFCFVLGVNVNFTHLHS